MEPGMILRMDFIVNYSTSKRYVHNMQWHWGFANIISSDTHYGAWFDLFTSLTVSYRQNPRHLNPSCLACKCFSFCGHQISPTWILKMVTVGTAEKMRNMIQNESCAFGFRVQIRVRKITFLPAVSHYHPTLKV